MPMELLTNEKLRSKITTTPNEVYLGFNFTELELKPINVDMVPVIRGQAMNLFDLYWNRA